MISDYYTETITLVSVSNSTDEFSTSEATETTSTFVGAINPSNGAEYFSGGRNFPDADYKVFCSDTVAVTDKSRVRWGGDTFQA